MEAKWDLVFWRGAYDIEIKSIGLDTRKAVSSWIKYSVPLF